MLLCISGIQYLSTLNLLDYRLSSIDKVNAATVLAGLNKLTRVLICYYVNIPPSGNLTLILIIAQLLYVVLPTVIEPYHTS